MATGVNEQISKTLRYKWGILEQYNERQRQWFMLTAQNAAKQGITLPTRKFKEE